MPQDLDRARELYVRACEGDAQIACVNLAGMILDGRTPNGEPRAARVLLERSCAAGESIACYELGRALRDGVGGDADPERARELFATTCRAPILAACRAEAQMIRDGVGGEANPVDAHARFRMACNAGSMGACLDEALLYLEPDTHWHDRDRAGSLLLRACLGEEGRACAVFAEELEKAPLAENDAADASAWRQRACESGYEAACGSSP